jgi:hypothetical protein
MSKGAIGAAALIGAGSAVSGWPAATGELPEVVLPAVLLVVGAVGAGAG